MTATTTTTETKAPDTRDAAGLLGEQPPDFSCHDCGVDTVEIGEYFMVHDSVWRKAGGGSLLCIACLEKRLGREVDPRDFTLAACNLEMLHEGSPRIRGRMDAHRFRACLRNYRRTGQWLDDDDLEEMRQEGVGTDGGPTTIITEDRR
jgi:hypothetical protein